jgi:hypothetical protein
LAICFSPNRESKARLDNGNGDLTMNRPLFNNLKNNYKLYGTHKCNIQFSDTCAIRLSEALFAVDNNFLQEFKKSGKNVCIHGYVRGAQDLAAILHNIWGNRDLGWSKPNTIPSTIIGKNGVICYMNIPEFRGQGHIDLWANNQRSKALFFMARGAGYQQQWTCWALYAKWPPNQYGIFGDDGLWSSDYPS